VAAARQVQLEQPSEPCTKPSAQARLHASAGQATGSDPVGHVEVGMQLHVGHPLASGVLPLGQATKHAIAGQAFSHRGPVQPHLPAVSRVQAAGMIVPLGQFGCAKGGGPPHSVVVQAGAGLQAQVGHPFASGTFPYWQ